MIPQIDKGPVSSGRNPLQGVTTALPVSLPGSSFPLLNQPVTHKKKQLLRKGVGGALMVGEGRKVNGELKGDIVDKLSENRISRAKPEWKTLHKKTLRFYGYFKEPVCETATESERVRKVIILLYLEDDTMQVSEPRQENSGITQGALVKRHRILKPDSSGIFTADDIRVGNQITIYGKTFMVVDCDACTRDFYESVGIPVCEPLPYPEDRHESWRGKQNTRGVKDAELKRVMELDASQRTGGTVHKLSAATREISKSFFANDRKVLRFYCLWHDTTVYGKIHKFVLLYFLSDKTCVVSETQSQNSGKDPFPTFLKRQRLPKPGKGLQSVSLETISSRTSGGNDEFYSERDFKIGGSVSVFGRELILCDMDAATKNFYTTKYGVTEEEMEPIPIDEQKPPPRPPASPPPHNSMYGSEEDSLGSWQHLVLKPPRRDIGNELKYRDKVLRFGAEMVSSHPADIGRKFIVCYYMADSTVQVFEQPQQNSGLVGGKFLIRQRVKTSKPGEYPVKYLEASALSVGATIMLLSTKFKLTEADKRTQALISGEERDFSLEDVNRILDKIRDFILMRHTQITDTFRYFDKDHSGGITLAEFRQVLNDQQIDVTEAEIVTLMNYFDTNGDGIISFHEFVDRMVPKDYSGELDSEKGVTPIVQKEVETSKFKKAQGDVDNLAASDKVFKMFTDKILTRRLMIQDTFRSIIDASPDGCIGHAEFRKCVVFNFQLNLQEHEVDLLVWRVFRDPITGEQKTRLPLKEFIKVFDNTSYFLKKYL
eukprot:TRINITY_DN3162_c1_g2_i2.p1 TRINITY_DN3162_c1_g2~~TRINITY_DN3162_c1_g2_i2.p1  ORF type:complete len:770 (+),score=130.80 TRINITY_DN3162_c1_g2_i2:47-2356(+)